MGDLQLGDFIVMSDMAGVKDVPPHLIVTESTRRTFTSWIRAFRGGETLCAATAETDSKTVPRAHVVGVLRFVNGNIVIVLRRVSFVNWSVTCGVCKIFGDACGDTVTVSGSAIDVCTAGPGQQTFCRMPMLWKHRY